MRVLTLLFLLSIAGKGLPAQEVDRTLPEFSLNQHELAGQMHFLASDYLAGRRTGSVGNEIAAEYLAAQLRGYGFRPANGASFFQDVPLRSVDAPERATLTIGDTQYTTGEDLLQMRGPALEREAPVVYANYGWVDDDHDDYANLDVAGKIVIVRSGIPGTPGQAGIFRGVREKPALAAARGAVAVFEIYAMPFPWANFRGYLGGERIGLAPEGEAATLPYGFLNAGGLAERLTAGGKSTRGRISTSGMRSRDIRSRNVAGILPGTDPALAEEYILLTAHFDHVGVGRQGGGAYTPQDSIFNGSRDNAFGTISLLAAARSFAERPTRRPVIVLGVTGEEMGLLGSEYYAGHPLVPLEQTVYNFNTDGGGYNSTGHIALLGAGRTGIDDQVATAAAAFGLGVINDPAPEQNLYDRSDNVSFAARGVPALTFSPGMTDMNEEIFRYYHQVTDNPETIDFAYLRAYCQAFTLAARLIADRDERPYWAEGDKYEPAGDKLYGGK